MVYQSISSIENYEIILAENYNYREIYEPPPLHSST